MILIFLIRKLIHFGYVYFFIVSVKCIMFNMQKENEKNHSSVITTFLLGLILKNSWKKYETRIPLYRICK